MCHFASNMIHNMITSKYYLLAYYCLGIDLHSIMLINDADIVTSTDKNGHRVLHLPLYFRRTCSTDNEGIIASTDTSKVLLPMTLTTVFVRLLVMEESLVAVYITALVNGTSVIIPKLESVAAVILISSNSKVTVVVTGR